MHTKLPLGSQTFRHKWRTLFTLLFLVIVLVSKVETLNGKLFFHLWLRFEMEVLSYSIFGEMFAIGFQNWFDHEWIELEYICWSRPRFVFVISAWTKVCKNCSFVFFFNDMMSFWKLVWGAFWSVLQMCHTFWPWEFLISIDELFRCNITSPRLLVRIWACFFCKWWWNDSLFTYENNLFCFQIFFNVNCLLMVYYVYHCSCFLKVVIEVKNCSCSLVGILVTNLCLWPAEGGKHLNFWRCIQNLRLVLKGSDINEGRCKHFSFCWLFC